MKKITKGYLGFCGINTIFITAFIVSALKKFKEEGYVFVKINYPLKDKIIDMTELFLYFFSPIINITITGSIIELLNNPKTYDYFYTNFREKLVNSGRIKKIENYKIKIK